MTETKTKTSDKRSVGLSELPTDELVHYGQELGLPLSPKQGRGELLRLIRERQDLLLTLDREAMLAIVIWARRPVRESSSKEELAKEISAIKKMRFKGLEMDGLVTLAKLRGLRASPSEPRAEIEARLKAAEPLWDAVQRRRRKLVGSVLQKLVHDSSEDAKGEYRFLPEDKHVPTLRDEIVDEGVVGGIARRLRGVADDYVKEKLDEIEQRIDQKLDEIDQRLAEWRDREVANRLKIIKITLVASVLVALLSLGYKLVTQ